MTVHKTKEHQTIRPCVRCLHPKVKRHRAGFYREHCIIQCLSCGFNVTDTTFDNAEIVWNGFKVWELVKP